MTTTLLLAALCGLLGGAIVLIAAIAIFAHQLKGSDCVTFSRGGPAPEFYKEVEVLEHALRPQGLYVRFRNHGTSPIEMAHFRVRGYKNDKLWVELEEGSYSQTQPGQEQETILKLQDYRKGKNSVDLSGCRVEVEFLYGYVHQAKPA